MGRVVNLLAPTVKPFGQAGPALLFPLPGLGFHCLHDAFLAGLSPSAIQRAIDCNHNPTKETLEKILEPFGPVLGVKELKVEVA